MSRKRSYKQSSKSYKTYSSNTVIILTIIVLIVIASIALIVILPGEDQEEITESDGKWMFALDTSSANVGSHTEYSTGYIPTIVIIDINGDIIHKDAGVHTKEQLLEYVDQGENPSSSRVITSAPDFTLETFDEKTFRLSDSKDKVVILDFMAVRCPPCYTQMPELFELKKELGDSIVILSIDVDAAYGRESKDDVIDAFNEYIKL